MASNPLTRPTSRAAGRACSPSSLLTALPPSAASTAAVDSAAHRRLRGGPASRSTRARPWPPPRRRGAGGRGRPLRATRPSTSGALDRPDAPASSRIDELQGQFGAQHGTAEVEQHQYAVRAVGVRDRLGDCRRVRAERRLVQPGRDRDHRTVVLSNHLRRQPTAAAASARLCDTTTIPIMGQRRERSRLQQQRRTGRTRVLVAGAALAEVARAALPRHQRHVASRPWRPPPPPRQRTGEIRSARHGSVVRIQCRRPGVVHGLVAQLRPCRAEGSRRPRP